MAKLTINKGNEVEAYINQVEPAQAKIIQAVRKIILSAGTEIAEHIKWNSPAFYYTGEMRPFDPKEYKRDIAVLNLHRGKFLLVMPTGAKISGFDHVLGKPYSDGRRIAAFSDLQDVKAKAEDLRAVIAAWLKVVDK